MQNQRMPKMIATHTMTGIKKKHVKVGEMRFKVI
jgi:hypothetical protein